MTKNQKMTRHESTHPSKRACNMRLCILVMDMHWGRVLAQVQGGGDRGVPDTDSTNRPESQEKAKPTSTPPADAA